MHEYRFTSETFGDIKVCANNNVKNNSYLINDNQNGYIYVQINMNQITVKTKETLIIIE